MSYGTKLRHKSITTMNRHTIIPFLILILALVACGKKGSQVDFAYVETGDPFFGVQNNTLFGMAVTGSTDSTLAVVTDIGDTLALSTIAARAEGKVLGGYAPGDRIALMLNADTTAIITSINETELLGEWVMPDPYDGSTIVGIIIKDGGIVEGIEQSNIIYKSWRIIDGLFEITYVREGGSEEDEATMYNIVKLNSDSLIYEADDEVFEYSRAAKGV